jgi:ribosomal protein S18 acetylase RimI-like enzyme
MRNQIKIRQLTKDDAADYRRIRLKALKNSPEAFGSLHSEELAKSELYFEKCLMNNDKENIVFGAFTKDELIAIVCLKKEAKLKTKHRAEILQMYVDVDHRNQKIGQQILDAILSYGFSHFSDLECVRLAVVRSNKDAIHLYEKTGFKKYATDTNYFKTGKGYDDIIFMKLAQEDI